MNLHRKFFKNSRQEGIARKSESTSEEVAKYYDFIGFGRRSLLIKRSATIANRKETSRLVFSDQICRDFGFTENKRWGK
jgi:hypothetical protein